MKYIETISQWLLARFCFTCAPVATLNVKTCALDVHIFWVDVQNAGKKANVHNFSRLSHTTDKKKLELTKENEYDFRNQHPKIT